MTEPERDPKTMFGLRVPAFIHETSRPRDPFEVIFSGCLLLSATFQMILGTTPGTLASLLPDWARILWGVTLVVGSLAVLLGVYWPNQVTGMFMESVGLSGVSSALIIYGFGIFVASETTWHTSGTEIAASITLMVGVAFGWKYCQLRQRLRRLPR